MKTRSQLVNWPRLDAEMERAGLDAIVAASPESAQYLAGTVIRTQTTIRDRLAIVVYPREDEPTFIVCKIEENLAKQGELLDIRTYVEFATRPIELLVEVLREHGLSRRRIGVETRYLSAETFHELTSGLDAEFVGADQLLERTRSIKTEAEQAAIAECYRRTERSIRAAFRSSTAGDTERNVAERIVFELVRRRADSYRHVTLTSGPNTVNAHMTKGSRRLGSGEIVSTDCGGVWGLFSSDMARMGILGKPSGQIAREYELFRSAYVDTLFAVRAGLSAGAIYSQCGRAFERYGLKLLSPHVGHSVSRSGGHENPILHPFNEQLLEPGMLIAVEPTYQATSQRRYHLEDLILVTEAEPVVITDVDATASMLRIPD